MAMDRRHRAEGYLPLRDAMERLFEGSVITPHVLSAHGNYPPVDVSLTEDDVLIEMAIPGADLDAITISVTGDTVTLGAEVKQREQT